MLIATASAAAVSSAILFTAATQSARNMIQTVGIRRKATLGMPDDNFVLPVSGASPADRLRAMNRGELLLVFANSRAPTVPELEEWFSGDGTDDQNLCDWDGTLLDNNSAFMNFVSTSITNGLFGGIGLPWRLLGESSKAKGRWNGKAFSGPSASGTGGKGVNRFESKATSSCFQRHAFDYNIVKSKILTGDESLSLRLDYSNYQSLPISLWASMRDELRVVELPPNARGNGDNTEVPILIGMGWMGWSGGPLNCSPFLLERSRRA